MSISPGITKVAFVSVLLGAVYKYFRSQSCRSSCADSENTDKTSPVKEAPADLDFSIDSSDLVVPQFDCGDLEEDPVPAKAPSHSRKQSVVEIINEMTRPGSELNYTEAFKMIDEHDEGVVNKEDLIKVIIDELYIEGGESDPITKVIYRIPTAEPGQITLEEWVSYVERMVAENEVTSDSTTHNRLSLTIEDFHAALDRVD